MSIYATVTVIFVRVGYFLPPTNYHYFIPNRLCEAAERHVLTMNIVTRRVCCWYKRNERWR